MASPLQRLRRRHEGEDQRPGLPAWGLTEVLGVMLRGVQRLPATEHRGDVAADDVDAVSDDAACETIRASGMCAEPLPAVARRVVGFKRA